MSQAECFIFKCKSQLVFFSIINLFYRSLNTLSTRVLNGMGVGWRRDGGGMEGGMSLSCDSPVLMIASLVDLGQPGPDVCLSGQEDQGQPEDHPSISFSSGESSLGDDDDDDDGEHGTL